MEKNLKLRILNIVLSSLCLIMFIIALLLKNLSAAERLEPSYFLSYMKNEGCNIINQSNLQDDVQVYYTTDSNTCPYSISYLIVNNASKRKEIYEEMKSAVKNNISIDSKEKVDYHSINYDEFSTTGENYKSVIKYKDSVLFIDVPSNLKKKALLFKQDFGYYIENKSYIYRTFLMACIALLLAILQVNRKLIGSSKLKIGIFEIMTKN